jgi:heavy metal sensor kinase
VRSFRLKLAVRFTALLVLAVALLGGTAFLALRHIIYSQVDEALLRLAEIETAATSDAPATAAHFHDNVYHPAQSEVSEKISRYAEIWTTDGQPVARSQNLGDRDLYLPPGALRAAAAGKEAWFTHKDALGTLRSLIYPLSHSSVQRSRQFLQVSAPLEPARDVLSAFLKILLLIGLLGAVGGFGGAWYFAGQAIRPVRQIAVQASELEPGRSAGDITVDTDSVEHRQLVEVLNNAFDRLLSAVRVQRQFTADASHEIRTPLAIIQGDIEVALRRDRSRQEYQELLVSTLQEVRRLTRIADDLLTLAKSDAGTLPLEINPLDIDAVTADLVRRYRSAAAARGIVLEYSGAGGVSIVGDEDWVRRAIGNVLQNAVRYVSEGGRIQVRTRSVEQNGVPVAQVTVEDDGPGIAPEDLPKLFERFYRGDPARGGGGTGLGLPIVQAIAEAHGGNVEVRSEPGEGTRVELTLPALAPDTKPGTGDSRSRVPAPDRRQPAGRPDAWNTYPPSWSG